MAQIDDLLRERYYQDGERSFGDIAWRVAHYLYPEANHEQARKMDLFSAIFYKQFIPSSPVLMNAAAEYPMMCSCFVLPIEDDIDEIMKSLHQTVRIQKYGGGVGINFSPIRPEGSAISTTGGDASGPVSFMKFWNSAMEVIRQAGKRQGALMGVLDWDHPDMLKATGEDFLHAKQTEGILSNFNLSVAADERFWEHYEAQNPYARSLMNHIATGIWNNGEPGLLFMDNINRNSSYDEQIVATNPCGEVPLPPYGACCLGSINLESCVKKHDGKFEFDKAAFDHLIQVGIFGLDRVIAKSWWPWDRIEQFELEHWPLGLGLMGVADALALLGKSYGDTASIEFMDSVMQYMRERAEYWADKAAEEYNHPKHSTLLSIAPTGSISMIAGVNYSIEPFFTHSGVKSVEQGDFAIENPVLSRVFEAHDIEQTADLARVIRETGSVNDADIPDDVKHILRTATEIPPEKHLKMQSVVQKSVDNSVSKTINLPTDYDVASIKDLIVAAHSKYDLKGLTMYRTGSREDVVIECPSGACDL